MRIIILHPAILADATLEDQDSMVQVEAIAAAITRLGWQPMPMPCTMDLAAVRKQLLISHGDAVFNLVESLDGADSLQYVPAALLDALGTPYTGAPAEAIFQTTQKLLAKQLLHLAGLPTPAWVELGPRGTLIQGPPLPLGEGWGEGKRQRTPTSEGGPFPGLPSPPGAERMSLASGWGGEPGLEGQWRFPSPRPSPEGRGRLFHDTFSCPWIIKAVWEHASRGLDDENIVPAEEAEGLPRRLRERQRQNGRPWFAEQFIAGREFNLSILDGPAGAEVLPPAEIDFSAFPPDKPRIVGHAAKWREDSFEFHHTPRRFDFPPADAELLARLRDLARACWELFRLRGYARVDFRVDGDGQPWILEINTNPCLSPDAGFAAAVERAGLAYDEAIRRIVQQATAHAIDGETERKRG